MDKLKPCPRCGSNAKLFGHDGTVKTAPECWVACEECGLSTRTTSFPERAIELWNTRPTSPAEAAKVLIRQWDDHGEGLLGELSCHSPGGDIDFFQMEPDCDGEWVRFDDVRAALRAIADRG